ncbi:DUF4249 domain-containing protein [Hufsiella ginkgonis]|uniref:DUF4249 domain-containing protein n=1 Tax=Hufsiella ginkgonis TaxID=2695274 RepID=UPI003F6FD81D
MVSSFISPSDDTVRVYLSWSSPFYGNRIIPPALSTASVTISDGTTSRNLSWFSRQGIFVIPFNQFPIAVGKTYELKVKTAEGVEASASTTIPALPVSPKFERLQTRTTGPADNRVKTHVFRFSVTDPAGTPDYYRFDVYQRTNESVYDVVFMVGHKMVDDQLRDGTLVEEFMEYDESLGNGAGFRQYMFDGYLLHVTPEYALFHQSLDRNNISEDNPFAEPALVYSNIKGGYGIFAGYSRSRISRTYSN